MLHLVHPARDLSSLPAPAPLVELSGEAGAARVSFAVSLLRRAQLEGETTAWIQKEDGMLYPPDLDAAGVDLDALVVVRLPDSAGPESPFRAAEMLLRSGAFGLLVIDVRGGPSRVHPSVQGRLLGAAREHRSRVLFLTDKTD
ncbi:MAG: recombinase A, partial [Gemmatimonadetes bacterium]|nr:recombinase A [Gemmatimonadota bacterium]